MKKRRKELIVLGIVILFAGIFVWAIVNYDQNINEKLEAITRTTLSEISDQQQYTANIKLENDLAFIKGIAKSIVLIGEDEERIVDFVKAIEVYQDFQSISVLDLNGIGIMSNGEIVDMSHLDFLDEIKEGKTVMTRPYYSEYTKEEIVYISTPIRTEKEVEGILLAELPISALEDMILQSFEGRGYNFIIDKEGKIIAATENSYTVATDDLFATLETFEFTGGTSLEEMKSNIELRLKGEINYNIGIGDSRIAEYRPLNYNDWYIVIVVPETVIAEGTNEITNQVELFNLQIIVISVIAIVGIVLFRRGAVKRIERAAYYDDLTGIPILTKLKIDILEILKREKNKEFAIVKMDIINFKAINELFDFESGNRVIKTIAETGKNAKAPFFKQGRVGTDEFLLFGLKSSFDNLEKTRYEYERKFRETLDIAQIHKIEFRYGRYFIPKGETDVNDIVNNVVMAHNYAKENNEVICDYDDAFKEKLLQKTEITNKMQVALEREEFKVFLQPKYSVENRTIEGAEALVRWKENDGKFIYPDQFIPIFEQNGFILQLDMYMLENVCKMIKKWIEEKVEPITISVNFSRVHFSNPNFVKEIKGIVDKYDIPSKYIEIELTERTIVENENALVKIVDDLHKAKFTLSMDDFGAGYSSLGILKTIDVDIVKLDKSFLDDSSSNKKGAIIMERTLKMVDELGMISVAEGVETEEQLEFLKLAKCHMAQGYLLARPMPTADFEELYKKDLSNRK